WCIGCTLCIKACPVDAIVGSHKTMHTVQEAHCTGCELCLPVCPVDCMHIENASGTATGWTAWTPSQAENARNRYEFHGKRMKLDKPEGDFEQEKNELLEPSQATSKQASQRKRAILEAAMATARQRQT
ncbi:MAG: hypothetical protein RLZZ401_424, partial [Pseudomonadota bacterium]